VVAVHAGVEHAHAHAGAGEAGVDRFLGVGQENVIAEVRVRRLHHLGRRRRSGRRRIGPQGIAAAAATTCAQRKAHCDRQQ
jgi:hypothetical protein